jgi:hypothetical protein
MHCNPIFNVISRLKQRGFAVRRLDQDEWEAGCPLCRAGGRTLLLTRSSLVTCRSAKGCRGDRILEAIGLPGREVFNPTPRAVLNELSAVPFEGGAIADAEPSEPNACDSSLPRKQGPNRNPTPKQGPDTSPTKRQRVVSSLNAVSRLRAGEPSVTVDGDATTRADEQQKDDALPAPRANRAAGKVPPRSAHDMLLSLAETVRTIRGSDGHCYGALSMDGGVEYFRLDSQEFRRALIRLYESSTGRIPPPAAVAGVLATVQGRAEIRKDVEPVWLRVAPGPSSSGTAYFLDLGDESRRSVEIRADGWSVVDQPRVHFWRPQGLRALRAPERGGSIDLLRKYVNVDDSQWPLLLAWLAAAIRPVGPYPLLVLSGEPGSAKTTLARVCRRLVDPHATLLRSLPKSERDLMIAARNNWLQVYDNISAFAIWQSDALCRLSTGGGFATRELFTNDAELNIEVQRPILVNGIADFVLRSDLIDRSIFLWMRPIPESERQGDEAFWEQFESDRAQLLGSLLDAVSGGIRCWPDVQLHAHSRMADLDRWGEAVLRGSGQPAGTFIEAYRGNRRSATANAIADTPLVAALARVLADRKSIQCTAAELLHMLNSVKREVAYGTHGWPKSSAALSAALRMLAPQLRELGVHAAFGRNEGRRWITMSLS